MACCLQNRNTWKTEKKSLLVKLNEVKAEKTILEAKHSDIVDAMCDVVPGTKPLAERLGVHTDQKAFTESLVALTAATRSIVETHTHGVAQVAALTRESAELKKQVLQLQRQLAELQQKLADRTSEKDKVWKELEELKNSLNSQERLLADQEAKKSKFLQGVKEKDKEIARLHELLEQSMKEVTVEGIMTASQLDGRTQRLSQKFSKSKHLSATEKAK